MSNHQVHPRKLEALSNDAIIAVIIEATSLSDAASKLDCDYKTVQRELSYRQLPPFVGVRAHNSVHTIRGVPPWSDEKVARMRELHLDGLSAQLIGEQIGMSKNAVCGKAHRLGLVLGTPTLKKPENKIRAPRPPSTLKGKPRPPRRILPAVNSIGGPRDPRIIPSGARQLAASRLAQQTRASDRALIDAAIAEGRITKLPSGHAWGVGSNSWAQVAQS